MNEFDNEQDRVEYCSGELRLYIDGRLKSMYTFDSKTERIKKMAEWESEFDYVTNLEIGIILDYEP